MLISRTSAAAGAEFLHGHQQECLASHRRQPRKIAEDGIHVLVRLHRHGARLKRVHLGEDRPVQPDACGNIGGLALQNPFEGSDNAGIAKA